MNDLRIGNRTIGRAHPTYIVAELSANHGGSLPRARETLLAMKAAGADAVKLQTYTADSLTIDCDRAEFRVGTGSPWSGRTLHELYREAHTPRDWHGPLFELAGELEMDVFSTPFDPTAVDFLEQFDPPAYKIASFELVDLPLIAYVASRRRPMIVSTGMGTVEEITEAVDVTRKAGTPLALLKCTSAYPAPPRSMNLRTLGDMSARFDVPVGLSDHTLGIAVPVTAVALGARLIEKHFTLSRAQPGPDSSFSLEPQEFKQMVEAVRVAEAAMGSVSYEPTEAERANLAFRRSLYAVADIRKGEPFNAGNVRSIRPSAGLAPKHRDRVFRSRASQDIARGTPIREDHLG